jgi:uncharacterized membrane protein
VAALKATLRILFAVFFVAAGINHFRVPEWYHRMVPPALPGRLLLVQLSGVAEVGLGLLLLVPRLARLAGWGLIALLVSVFPANIYMALHPDLFAEAPPWALWARLPLQGVLIFWAYAYARRPRPVLAPGPR